MSFAKSCPDRSQVKGAGGSCAVPGARTAVPMAWNRAPPRGKGPRDSRTPTTPCPPSAVHSAVIRSMAACRAWYMACTSGAKDPGPFSPDTWVAGPGGVWSRSGLQVPGQLNPVYPTL
jgi:hypothetical protein